MAPRYLLNFETYLSLSSSLRGKRENDQAMGWIILIIL